MSKLIRKEHNASIIRYEIRFLEIGAEKDHVHFLVQSVPTYSPSKMENMGMRM
jgi:REP element-mobilizing transposase RayT